MSVCGHTSAKEIVLQASHQGDNPRAVLGRDVAFQAAQPDRGLARVSSARTRSAAAAASSAIAMLVAFSSRPALSGRPRQSSSGARPGDPDRDLALALPPRAAEAVGDHHRGTPGQRGAQRARRARPGRAGAGSASPLAGVGGVDARVGAHEAVPRAADQPARVARARPPPPPKHDLDVARVLAVLRGERAAPAARADVGEPRRSGPRPWRRPCERSRRRRGRSSRGGGQQRREVVPGPDLRQARERDSSSNRGFLEQRAGARGAARAGAEGAAQRREVVGRVDVELQRAPPRRHERRAGRRGEPLVAREGPRRTPAP